jgi:WD40 repeat protein
LYPGREDHGPEDDHMDEIVGLDSCNKMKLVASASKDGTLIIWNEVNNVCRQVTSHSLYRYIPQLIITSHSLYSYIPQFI